MSSRGVSVSWGDSESFIGEPAAKGSYASSGFLRTSSHNAKVLSFSHSCPSQYWEANPSASGASAAKQMTANDLDWLKPWRTPQDGRGGFALLCSMQEILCNVQRARLSSMKEVYSPLCSRSGSVSNRLVDTWDGNASLSSTLRLSMRRGNRRPRLTASTTAPATGAEGGGAGEVLNSSVTSMGSTSKSATLMDYMLSDGRMWQTSHMWLDDSTLPRPTTDTARSSSDHAGELRQRPAQGRRDAPPLCDVEAPPPQRSAAAAVEGGGGAARPAASTGVVPPIPHFEELQAIQAELQRLQQANPSHHPRSEAAQRRLRLLTHSSDEDSAHEEADTRYDGSPGAHLQVTACLTPGTGSGTARPAPPPPPQFNSTVNCSDADESSSPSSSPRQEHGLYCDDRLSLTDAEDEEDVSDCMSVTNFGEDGHLACVPGDTLHGRYTLLQVLGVGRSSRVWLAADLEQCSHTRRHLIRELGEREARRLFRPSEHPMFVALKVFRCGAMYTDCATYEAKLSAFVKDSVKLRPLRLLRSPPSSLMSPLISPTSVKASTTPSPTGGSSSGDRGPAARPCVGRPRANSSTPFVGSPSPRLPAPGNATRTAGISHPSQRLSTFRDQFAVEGQYGTHQCLVMDVLGSGIDTAINETHLAGFPSEVARSILLSSLQGLALLAACNVIHADLKPENLLFTDLDADVASAMRAFQSVQLQTGCRSALWSSFTHQRESVREFAQRVERESASLAASASVAAENGNSPHATVAATHAETEEGALHLDANGDLSGSQCVAPPQDHMAQRQADLSAPGHSSRLHSAAAAAATTKDEVGGSDGRRRCPGLTCSALSATRDGDGSAAPTPPRARRPAYEVRVSDFGLSFITPPCLRLGVRALARYADEVGTTVDDLVHDDALSQLQWLYEQQQQQPPQSPSGARVAGLSPLEMARCSNNIGSSRSAGWECGAAAPEWTVDCELIDEAELRALQLEDARGLHSEDDVVGETEGAGEGDAVADTAAEDESVAGNGAAATTATVAVEFTSVMSVGVAAAGSPSKRQKKKNYPHSTQPSHAMSSVNCSTNHSSCSVDDRHVSAGNTPDSPLMDRLAAAAVAPPVALQTASYHSPVSKTFTVLPSAALMASSPHSAPHDEDEEGLDATAPSPLSLFSSPNDAPILARHKGRGGAVDGNAVASTVSTTRMSLACPSAFQLPPPASTAGVTPSRQARHAEPVSLRQPRRSPAFAQTSLTSLRRLEVSILRSQQYARGIVMQSREYRAPEVLLGYFALPSCDVWSIGCIAYELVTGRFLIDCIADRERHGRQLARHVHGGGGGQTRASSECESCAEDEDYGGIEWDGQPIYVEDNEQDLSIFQLKSMMRLLGPPPIAFLHQHPTGLFVGDYYDENGDFKYWDGVENACGVGVVDANRRQELRASEGRWRSCSSSSSSSDGRGHPPAAAAPTSIHSKVTKGNGRCLACDNEEVGEGGGEGGEARVAPHGSRHRAHDLIEPPSHVESSSGVPAVPADYRSLRRSPHAAPFDTRNYAVETPGWLEVRRTLRRKLKSEEEARDFESFMWKCLQWDPAQRATAAELLADDWIMKYSHKVASAVDSDGEGGGGCDGVEPKLEMPTKAAPARRTRREPTYFYKSASASVEGKVRFSEGCVVLPHARICVPPNFVLEVGPFTLFSDFSELHITASPSSASGATDAAAPAPHAAVTTVRIRSHNHFQSYASLRFDLHAAVSALPQGQPPAALNSKVNEPALALPSEIELLGMGNVFHPFASVHVRMIACAPCALRRIREGGDAQSSEASRQPWQLGDWNVFSAHTRVLLPPRAFDAAPAGRAPSGLQAESSRGPLLSPDPITAPWEVATVQHIHNDDRSISRGDGEHEEGTAEAYRRATTPTMPGRVSVEERLFDHHSSDEDRAAIDTEAANLSPSPAPSSSVARAAAAAAAAASAPTAAPSRATTTSRVVDEGSASRSPPDGARSHALRPTPTRTDNMIYMLHDAAEALSAEMSAAADSSNVVALPRYGVRSVSELPTIVKRIVEEEMQRKEHTEHQQLPSTSPATPEPSPATATAATLANLKSYVSSVHPELRAYTEEHARTQVEQLCRCFIGQYMEEAELQPVDAQCDEASRAR